MDLGPRYICGSPATQAAQALLHRFQESAPSWELVANSSRLRQHLLGLLWAGHISIGRFPFLEMTRASSPVDECDGRSALGRRRHFSDSRLPLAPLPLSFTQIELEAWLDFFQKQRSYEWKIFQHLEGTQVVEEEEVANYPHVSTKAKDTGTTALHVAAAWGNVELARALLKAGADSSIQNNNGSSPIHLAISQKREELVRILLDHSPQLVSSYNTKNGFYPLHTAAYHLELGIAGVLLEAGSKVEQDTEVTEISPASLSVFHLAANEFAKVKTRKIKDRAEVERRMTYVMEKKRKSLSRSEVDCKRCGGPEEVKEDCDKLKERTLKMLEYLLSNMEKTQLTNYNYSKGSLLHCFCSVDFFGGVKQLLGPPYLHPPDLPDGQGITPLLLALSLGHLSSAKEILAHEVDVSLIHPSQHLTPLQLLIKQALTIGSLHLEVVQLLLDQGADPTLGHESDSPVCMATSDMLDVKLLDKFLDYLDSSNINTADRITGETLLHFAAAASRDHQDIRKLLEKGADIMVDNKREGVDGRGPVLPMEVAIEQDRGNAYFTALTTFGFSKLVGGMKDDAEKIQRFLQTHLVGGAKEKERDFMQEVLLTLQVPKVVQLDITKEELNKIIHYKKRETTSTVFCKTALSWANENNDRTTCLDLLRLEKQVHDGEDDSLVGGLRCLKSQLSSDSLLPWIIETYQDFYNPGPGRWIMAMASVLCELVFVSYIPYLYDMYSDIYLAVQYHKIGQENSRFNESQLWYCREEHIAGEVEETDQFRESFLCAYWITTAIILISSMIYVITVLLHSSPRFIRKWEARYRRHWEERLSPRVVQFSWLFIEIGLVSLCKIAWPLVHIVRRVRYRASTRRSGERCLVLESDMAWGVIKTVEHGLEAGSQLFLQMWLLGLYLPVLATWSSTETLVRSVTGAANFLTFDLYPACFLEKSLGKISLNLVSLSMGAAFAKVTKHGVPACDRPLRILPIFTSYFLQILARLYAFKLLLELEYTIGDFKLLIFFLFHFLCVLVLRLVCEGIKLRESPLSIANLRSTITNVAKFLLGVLASSIIMVHIHSPDASKQLFLSHTFFFLLVLAEHMLLVLLSIPAINASTPLLLIGLWVASMMMHLLHYTWAHPWASLNGPPMPKRWRRDRVRSGREEIRRHKDSITDEVLISQFNGKHRRSSGDQEGVLLEMERRGNPC